VLLKPRIRSPQSIHYSVGPRHVVQAPLDWARSTGRALFVGGWALAQLWLFLVAPLVGGALGGIHYRWFGEEPSAQVTDVSPATSSG
jgi:hypothetical protein